MHDDESPDELRAAMLEHYAAAIRDGRETPEVLAGYSPAEYYALCQRRLAHAAPDLLAACRAAIRQIARLMPMSTGDDIDDLIVEVVGDKADLVLEQLEAAVAKAEGREGRP